MKNDVCIVLPCNIYTAPYYSIYERILSENNIEFDLIIWNRDLIKEKTNGNVISFDVKDIANNGDKKKVINYLRFQRFVKKNLKIKKYKKVIFLSTSAGTVALLSLFLKGNYKKNYWIDIRDYSFEKIMPYKEALSIAIRNSYATSISSIGYKRFLPKHDYIITHNIDFHNIELSKKNDKVKLPSQPLRISFIGNIRYFEENEKLLQIFKNDERFILQYFGSRSEILKKYCIKNGIENVEFHGRFDPEKTSEFYAKTDIINNCYGNGDVDLTTALSNKLYYAASLNIPILVSPNTYMEEISTSYEFGFVINLDDTKINDKLFHWYMALDKTPPKYEEFMDSVFKEYTNFEDSIENFIKSEMK